MHALVIGLKARVVLAHYHIRSSSFCYVGWPAVAVWLRLAAGIFVSMVRVACRQVASQFISSHLSFQRE